MKFWFGSGSADPYLLTTVMNSDPDPAIFVTDLQVFLLITYFLKVHHFSKIKSHKEVTKQYS
jgi:hypothetical protein